jgi:hypothetical protein
MWRQKWMPFTLGKRNRRSARGETRNASVLELGWSPQGKPVGAVLAQATDEFGAKF